MRQQGLKLGSRTRERGLTMINFFLLAILIGGYFWIGIKLFTPIKTDWEVDSILDDLSADSEMYRLSKEGIEKLIMRRMNVNSLYHIQIENVTVEKTSRNIIVQVEKDFVLPLATRINLTYHLDRTLTLDIMDKTSKLE